MATYSDRLDLPYSRQQMFDLVADIESYPCFIPHIEQAHVRQRNGNEWLVDQVIHVRMFKLPVSTRASLDPPSHIRVVCNDGKLGDFIEDWAFEDAPAGGTRLTCVTEFHTHSGLLNRILAAAANELHRSTMQAFAARAHALFRQHPGT